MKKIKLLLLPFVLLLTFVLSCQKDMDEAFDVPHIQDNLKGSNLRQTYEKRFKNDSLLTALKIEPIWNTSVEFEHAIEVAFKTDGKLSFPSSKKGLKGGGRERLLLLEKPQGGYSIIKVRYKPSEDFKKDLKKINTGNFTKEQFDGIITLEELGSGKMKVMELSQGKLLKSKMRYKSSRNNNLRAKDDCVLIECFAEDTNWYQWSNGSGEWYYTNTNTEYYCEYTYLGECGNVDPNNGEDPYDCSQNPNSPWCTGGNGNTNSGNVPISAQDINVQLQSNPCANSVYQTLISVLPNSGIDGFINNFAQNGQFANFKLNILISNNPAMAGRTSFSWDPNDKEITIELKESYLNEATRLGIAKTIIHEGLHAYMYAYLKDRGISNFTADFPDVVVKYNETINTHNAMSNYVTNIANALSAFDNNRLQSQYYLDLAWSGLFGTPDFNALPSADKDRSILRTNDEAFGNPTAQGLPCN